MNFYEALAEALNGERITRQAWDDKGTYGFFINGILTIRRDFKYHQWILHESDILADDWIVI